MKKEFAFITPKGISYGGRYFTCPLAIKENWFFESTNNRTLVIPVVSIDEFGQLLLQLDNEVVLSRAISIEKRFSEIELSEYYLKFQELKRRWKEKKV